ncbi:hypothetical protein PAEPH01_1103 [Pancytospora epiphaga]|nr:hypothetical protein PAEPH01_1103 [Pancytospora epiphaga]
MINKVVKDPNEVQDKNNSVCNNIRCISVVTNYYKQYSGEIGLTNFVETYIQAIVLKKTLKSISFKYRSINNKDAAAITVRLKKKQGDPRSPFPRR